MTGLLEAAERVEAACDLDRGVPAQLAEELIDACERAPLDQATPRALWNLLWLAGELSTQVDVYLATRLLEAVVRLFERHLGQAASDGELAATAEMAFDFFFNRAPGDQPLAIARVDETLTAMQRVLSLPSTACQRAGLHGLSHLRRLVDGLDREHVDAAFDGFLLSTRDVALAEYAARARAGTLP